jgi:hypothetical protein
MATTHLPARDVCLVISDGTLAEGTLIQRVQSASVDTSQNTEDVRELGSTDFWTFYNEPTVDVSIERNCIGDSIVQTALNSNYVAGTSTLKDMIYDATGALITKNLYLCGGDTTGDPDAITPEIIFGAVNCYLSGVDFTFDVGGMATESWRFEASEVSDGSGDTLTALGDPGTPSVITALTAASGYGGIRHSDVDVQICGDGIDDANAIVSRVQSVTFSGSVSRTPYSELMAVSSGGYVGPFVRIGELPFDVTATIELFPSEHADEIFTQLGTINSPTTAGSSTAVVQVKLTDVSGQKIYRMSNCIMQDVSFAADAGGVGTISLTVKAFDLLL